MKLFSGKKDKKFWFISIAGICQNISAAWWGLALISPGIAVITKLDWLSLTKSVFFGILFLYLSVWFIKRSK